MGNGGFLGMKMPFRVNINGEILFIFFLFITFGLMVFIAMSDISQTNKNKAACRDADYPTYKKNGYQSGYCIKRVDGTDYVIKVEDLE